MKKVYLLVTLLVLLVSASSTVVARTEVSIGHFEYIDLADIPLVDQPMQDFVYLLELVLTVKSGIQVVNDPQAEQAICGRITRLNSAGDARVEIGFGTPDSCSLGVDAVADMVTTETTMDASVDAVIGLLDQTRETIAQSLGPQEWYRSTELFAER